jgi:hypothetical protein
LLAICFTRGRFFAGTSADTSNVQRTPWPARSGGIRFATATGRRNARAADFPQSVRDGGPGGYRTVTRLSTLRPQGTLVRGQYESVAADADDRIKPVARAGGEHPVAPVAFPAASRPDLTSQESERGAASKPIRDLSTAKSMGFVR